jgi:hypothetical protein
MIPRRRTPQAKGARRTPDTLAGMEAAFGAVVIVVSILGIVAALLALASGRGAYDRIGHGPLSVEDAPAPDVEVDEVRQLVEARNARRIARGEPPLDVEQEVLKRLRDG